MTVVVKELSAGDSVARLIDTIWEPFFLSMTGLGKKGMNTPVWYISAMLLSMAVLYPLLRKHHDITIHLIIPLASLLIFGYLYQNYGHPRGPSKWLGWTHKGMLRAFAEIGIGCLLFYLSNAIRRIRFKRLGKWLITLTENAIYIVVICYMYLAGASKYDYFFIAILAIAVALTFSEAGIHNRIYDNSLIYKLGKFSAPLFFSHWIWAYNLNAFVPVSWRIRYRLQMYLVMSFITAYVVMISARAIRRNMPTILGLAKKYLVEPDDSVQG